MARPMFGDVLALIGVVAIMGSAVAVVVHRWPEIGHWPGSPPAYSEGTTCWHFAPQPDITAPELATILLNTQGGELLGKVAVKPDNITFPPLKRHFVQIDCGGK